jgi:hypothetical protein
MDKDEIIKKGELGFSKSLLSAGYKYRALYDSNKSGMLARLFEANPSYYLWREIIEIDEIPFVKLEAIRDAVSPVELQGFLAHRNPSLGALIERHRERTAPFKNPQQHGLSVRIHLAFLKRGYRLNHSSRKILELANFLAFVLFFLAFRAFGRSEREARQQSRGGL